MSPESFKQWRKDMSYTQKQASEALGVCLSTIEKWEAGSHPIPAVALLATRALFYLDPILLSLP